MKLIIAGGRSFNNYELLKHETDLVLMLEIEPVEIVSGTAGGADRLGERYAKENGYVLKRFPADWDLHGKSAGYKRNKVMAEYATDCLCFWDGMSKGTEHMIRLAEEYKLNLTVIKY